MVRLGLRVKSPCFQGVMLQSLDFKERCLNENSPDCPGLFLCLCFNCSGLGLTNLHADVLDSKRINLAWGLTGFHRIRFTRQPEGGEWRSSKSFGVYGGACLR